MVVPNPAGVGILTFETAAAMARLVSLHRMVSDTEVLKLRSETMRSQGVAYLSSTDQSLLIRLACAELVDELDRTAEVVSRLSQRCHGQLPVGFDRVYTDLKTGSIDPSRLGLKYAGKGVDKRIKRMEKHISRASKLYSETEVLAELEETERKKWGRFSGPIQIQKPPTVDDDSIQLDIKSQHHKVRKLRESSLWSRPFDKAVELMALACYSIFARICVVFGPFVPGLPPIVVNRECSRLFFAGSHVRFKIHPRSGPLERPAAAREVAIRNSCPIVGTRDAEKGVDVGWAKMLEPAPSTVGGSGLAQRYAEIILLAEKAMMEGAEEAEAERKELYEMLPLGLRTAVSAKLRKCWRERGPVDGSLADGWKDAVWRILGWLGPVAHDTVEWQAERNMDRRQRYEAGPRKYLLQTLHFSDRVKTEAAIVEVLTGLSLVCWYDELCRSGSCRYLY